jgi:hypothetical protein
VCQEGEQVTENMTRADAIAHAREVDERIATEWDAYWEAMKDVPTWAKSKARAEADAHEAEARADRAGADMVAYWGRRAEQHRARVASLAQRIEVANAAAKSHADAANAIDAAEYTGWRRFWLVQHIHASQYCSSFRPTTRVGWLPDVSGLTEAEAVKEHGAILCTICFPSAPVEWTRGKQDDPATCSGSTYSKRVGMGGICAECGQYVAYKSWNDPYPRKHKKAAA